MNDGILELKEFFVEGHQHDKSHVILHITEPSPHDVKKGYFFALAEIQDGSRDEIIEMEKIFDDLEKTYYSTENTKEKHALELSLEFINRRAHEVLGDSEATIDCIVGALENFHLTFSTHGAPVGLLFYSKNGTLEHLSIVDPEETNEKQFFSSLVEGDLHQGDFLLLATPQTSEFFSAERLEKLILSRPTVESVDHIQKVLKQLRSGISYGGVLFHSAYHQQAIQKAQKKPREATQGSVASIDSMVQRAKETETTLSPPLFLETRQKLKSFLDERKDLSTEQIPHQPTIKKAGASPSEAKSYADSFVYSLGKVLIGGIKGIAWFFIGVLRVFQVTFSSLYYITTNQRGQREHVLRNIKSSYKRKIEYFQNLPLISKVLFSIALFSACAFLGSVVYLKFNEKQQQQIEQYNNLITAIEEKKNAAEASLLYEDRDRALTLLTEAKEYVKVLPKDSPEEQQKVALLEAELEQTLGKLKKMTLVEGELVANLSEKNNNVKATRLIKLDTNIIASGKEDTSLYIIAPDTKNVETQLHDTIPQLSSNATPKEQDKIVFISGNNSIAEFNKTTKALASKEITFPSPDTKLQSLVLYNGRLYALDIQNNQIFKHNQTLSGYDKGVAWITDSAVDVKNAVSIAIDGEIYALKNDGKIIKLSAGKEAPFAISGLFPELKSPTELWTSSDSTSIYILEPVQKRIVVLDKEGKFIKQYTSQQWQNPSSMVIDEKAKKIYVLDTNKVYQFGI